MDHLPGYDAWKTRAPEDDFGWCPECGCSQEDADMFKREGETVYRCAACQHVYTDDEAHPDYSQEEPDDFDERRCQEDGE